jgi:hypothetical protein
MLICIKYYTWWFGTCVSIFRGVERPTRSKNMLVKTMVTQPGNLLQFAIENDHGFRGFFQLQNGDFP